MRVDPRETSRTAGRDEIRPGVWNALAGIGTRAAHARAQMWLRLPCQIIAEIDVREGAAQTLMGRRVLVPEL